MPYGELCRCCLLRPPDRGLKTQYSMVGKSEVYADMLKECFEIQMPCTEESEMGICEICVTRLRDASDFKLQVQQCQKQFMTQLKGFAVKDETSPKVKEEYLDLDDDNDIYFLELKEEASDGFELKGDDDDDKKLAEMFGFTDVTVKRTSDRRRTKKRLLLDNGRNELKEEVSDDFGFNDDDNKKLAEMFGIKRKNKNGLNDLNPKSRIKLSLHVGQSRLLASPRHSGVSDAKKYRANVVQQCQKQFMTQLKGFAVKDETSPKVKEEYLDLDDDNDIYFLELKEEASDGFELKGDDDDDKKLAEMFGFTDVTVKRTSDRRRTKKRLLLDNGRNELKEEVSDDFGFNDDDNKKLAEMFAIKRKNKNGLNGYRILFITLRSIGAEQ
ncbi:hypothetical protein B5X24_HaOG209700 [Helicoverpa armigera]|uniref:ZAD domain-containing protein n=1 Tax=Helicoverpa armigera TaxID=29058 RepID=A0A2W1BKQ7_HELAM|nr:hypothetical protein B5X24_HaOG209700 [Helicoverpa armigera]